VIVVADAAGKVVARSRGQTEFVGKPGTDSFLRLIAGRDEGWGEAATLDGQTAISVFQRSPVTQWVTAVGLPAEVVDGPVLRRYLLLGSGLIASLGLGLFAAWGVSLAISRPVEALGDAAAAMGEGKRPEVPDTPLPEIRKVGEALAAAHIERDKLLKRERVARRQAEEANRLKDEFLAMLGHELRNPLSAISNASQILDHVSDTRSGIGQEATAIIRRQSAHLALLTDELLDVARVMAGNIPMEHVPVNLGEVVERTVATFRATGRLDKHQVAVDIAPAWVAADATRLDQIASNLLTNAVKYTPHGGSIRMAVRREHNEGVEQAVLEVSDNGVGLEPELLERVFDLFVQGERSLDRSQGGLGVGLTLVKKLAELLGGGITAASEGAWKGSRFTVRLPAIEPPAGETHASLPHGASKACRTVIVEDNEDARQSLRVLLTLEGHEVHEAADGNAGIETILRVMPDVALVDIGLPGADGYEVARRVRAQLGDRIKLVAVTGYGLPEDRKKSADAGFDLHLVKPVDEEGLAKVFG
jgi:signal transduction histidine kinase